MLGSSEFEVDVRYMNLKPIGRGAYGLVAAADDLVCWSRSLTHSLLSTPLTPPFYPRCSRLPLQHCACPAILLFVQITGRKVAIKRISKVFLDLIDAKRILREIKLLRHLGKHENIVDVLDIMTGTIGGTSLWL